MRKLVILIALVLTMSTASAQMIGATNNQQTPRVQRVDNSPVFRPTGGSLRFKAGIPWDFLVSYNHYVTSYFMIGGGTGIAYDGEGESFPIYAEMDLRTPKFKWSLFLNIRVGVDMFAVGIDLFESGYFAASLGVSYKNLNAGFGLSTVAAETGWPEVFVSYNLPISTIEKLFK